ncbi:glycosyltransferase [Pseudomonas veronii]|uniref:glycosyltransferase n=1 Tax=Pseudomonas veronii TaxID=76761 RepID=UPI002D771E37|nr:glycosyltransferase [Pseudomonas veronii]WRU65246.1 glycosyltransferase [Pseudomonas veronii]
MKNNHDQPKIKKLFYVQPILAGYRTPIIEKLANHFDTYAFYDNTNAQKQGHMAARSATSTTMQSPSISLFGERLFYQRNVINKILQIKPDAIISFANPRFVSFWLLMIISCVLKIKFYAHGQGLYSYPKPSRIRKLMYRTICRCSTKYVCYTELSKETLIAAGCDPRNLVTIQNSLELQATIHPDQKTYKEKGVLFIGRLRDGCRVDILIKAIQIARSKDQLIELHIIGGGQLENYYKTHYGGVPWIHWYGAIHDNLRIAEISKSCRIGCYPGDAGLSVVHMFGLGLPPLLHRNIEEHMGPEPSYIIENTNGFLFNPSSGENELSATLNNIWELPQQHLRNIANAAYTKYLDLNNPAMGDQFVQLVHDNEN